MIWTLLLLVACGDDTDSSSCTEEAQQCSDDGTAIEQCTDGAWATWQTCDIDCVVNSGTPECTQEGTDQG